MIDELLLMIALLVVFMPLKLSSRREELRKKHPMIYPCAMGFLAGIMILLALIYSKQSNPEFIYRSF